MKTNVSDLWMQRPIWTNNKSFFAWSFGFETFVFRNIVVQLFGTCFRIPIMISITNVLTGTNLMHCLKLFLSTNINHFYLTEVLSSSEKLFPVVVPNLIPFNFSGQSLWLQHWSLQHIQSQLKDTHNVLLWFA